MSTHTEMPSREYIEVQRQRLESLRAELLGAERERIDSVKAANDAQGDEAREFEDMAQDMARDEIRQARHDVDAPRLANVERALQKIREGSYGVSDLSGSVIPVSRLDAVPEAILTVDEAAGS